MFCTGVLVSQIPSSVTSEKFWNQLLFWRDTKYLIPTLISFPITMRSTRLVKTFLIDVIYTAYFVSTFLFFHSQEKIIFCIFFLMCIFLNIYFQSSKNIQKLRCFYLNQKISHPVIILCMCVECFQKKIWNHGMYWQI